jgi:subtilisin family serine protease
VEVAVRRWFALFASIAVAVGALLSAFAAGAQSRAGSVSSPDVAAEIGHSERARVIVVFDVPGPKADVTTARGRAEAAGRIANARAQVLSGLSAGDFETTRTYSHVNAVAGWISAAGLERMANRSAVRRIDLDLGGAANLNQARPLSNVDAVQALGLTGAGVTIAVLDSGYDTDHPDLADDLAGEACFCSGSGGCCPGGGSTQTGAGAAEDDNGHGTNVSGIITSKGSTTPLGSAPDADIVAVKVLAANGSFCCSSDVIAGLNWIIANRPDVDAVNMSLGTFAMYTGDCDNNGSSNMAYAAAIDTLRSSGVPVFVSTGNGGSGTQMQSPACIANSISVGAVWDSNVGSVSILGCTDSTTAADKVTCFTNSNSQTDLFAPGAPITSTGVGGGSSTYYGTSQASPLAAGCAALLLEDDPTLTPDEIEMLLEASPIQVTDSTNGLDFPRVDCAHAEAYVKPIPALPILGVVAAACALLAAQWLTRRPKRALR